MENKKKYIIIFSILFMFLALVSVSTAQEVNSATVSKQNLTDYASLELNKSKEYQKYLNGSIKAIEANEKIINNTKKKIKTYDKQLTTKNKQLKNKNKQLKTYNNKLKKLNKKLKTKTLKKNILKTKKTIKTIKKQMNSYKKGINIIKKKIKDNKNLLKNCIAMNTTLIDSADNMLNEAWRHLDSAAWATSWANSYSIFGGSGYYDYGYYWKYPEAKNNYYSKQPVDFSLFMSGQYVY